jgi:DNA (cytosine-5)-methyltransferase 1
MIVVRIPVIGLFSGAGGLEIGAEQAGADVRVCVEIDPVACQTLRLNSAWHRGAVHEADVTKLDGATLRRMARLSRREPCLVIGGPPCQPFSKLSYWTDPGDDSRYRRARARGEKAERPTPITEARPDERRSLVDEFWRLVLETRAEGFLFENVPSITHPRNKAVLDRLIESADSAGYGILLLRVNAVEYGVPQCRHRIVLMGLRQGTPALPEKTHAEESGHLFRPVPVTAGEARAAA